MEPRPPPNLHANPAPEETLSDEEGRTPEPPPAASVPWALVPGTGVHRYVVLDRVGAGGMGVVYAAYDPSLDRRVALKFLAPHAADRHGVREKRLLREAQAMARLSHPNVAVAFDVGTFQGHVFLAMEFVDGVDLRTWLAEKPRPLSQILDVFRAAGHGLAAAHAAGIIHRDFKPTNVLLDKHERPRVMDFGLSRYAHDAEEGAAEPTAESTAESPATVPFTPSLLSSSLTRTGGVLGTPSYMPPEQRGGGMVDARSDQYSFCVALYEALYGEHPFLAKSAEGTPSAAAGRVAPAPAESSVPKRYRQALLRGLSAAPENRFPSMEALLAALTPRPTRDRRLVAILASLAVILAAAAGYSLFFRGAASPPAPRCDQGARRLDRVWDEPRKRQLRDAFLRSGARGAEVTWNAFSSILDSRASAWVAMYDQACAATHLDGTQSPAVLDLRTECLERKHQEMKALVEVYAEKSDASTMDQAVDAADRLSTISACANVANLRAVVPPPEDPAIRARVQSVRQRLIHSRALFDAGRYEEGRKYMLALKQEADAVGYAVLSAEAGHELGSHISHRNPEEATDILLEAAKQAVVGRDWTREAEIMVTVLGNYARAGQLAEGLLTAPLAEIAVDRASGDDILRGRLATNVGYAQERAGKTREALGQYQRAEQLFRRAHEVSSRRFARILIHNAFPLITVGRVPEALDYLERAQAIQRATLRPDHPDVIWILGDLGQAYILLGLYEKAREVLQTSYEIGSREYGPESDMIAWGLQLLALAESLLGNSGRALDLHEKARSSLMRGASPDSVDMADTYVLMGDAQRRAGLGREAERTLERAIQHNLRIGMPDHVTTGQALLWLGHMHNSRGLYRRAIRECRRGLDILSRELGPESSNFALPLECLGEALIGTGKLDAARVELERVLTLANQWQGGPQWTANAHFQLARALWPEPAERPRARELARATLAALSAAEGDNRKLIARIRRWLSTHADSPAHRK